jgi:hypothetical protein
MLTITSRAAAAAIAAILFTGTAFAQSTAAPAPAKKTEKPRSAASLACSKQADEKGLHGKERKKFRSDCMKEAKGTADKAK